MRSGTHFFPFVSILLLGLRIPLKKYCLSSIESSADDSVKLKQLNI